MKTLVKVLVGAAVAVGVSLPLLGGAYAVSNNPGTTFKGGPNRVTYEPPVDQCRMYTDLVEKPVPGPFTPPYAAKAWLHTYVQVCGHQPYTIPQDPYDIP